MIKFTQYLIEAPSSNDKGVLHEILSSKESNEGEHAFTEAQRTHNDIKKRLLSEEKNVHMEHVEDVIFNEGVDGTRRSINFLRDLRDMLSGNAESSVSVTVKWDGAPAIFAGIDPRDGKFFVAKKGVFNKTPKVYKTLAEIDEDTTGDLAAKLKVALNELSKVGIESGVYQGDLMFTDDKKVEVIDGQKYITFHPNTIVYAVPYNSELGKKIRSAKLGVVWHTTYSGDSFESMKASFGKSIVDKMNQSSTVWMDDATYRDESGTATFTKVESDHLTSILSRAGKLFNSIQASVMNDVRDNEDLKLLIKTFNNSKIRQGQEVLDSKNHVRELFDFISNRFKAESDKKKTPAGKAKVEDDKKKMMSYFAKHDINQIAAMFEMMILLTSVKKMIIEKMNKVSITSTFLKTKNGFKVTNVEGYVAIDHMNGGAVKIVDRMEFSKNNFDPSILKGWQR